MIDDASQRGLLRTQKKKMAHQKPLKPVNLTNWNLPSEVLVPLDGFKNN